MYFKKKHVFIMVDFNIFQLSTCLNRFSETDFSSINSIFSWIPILSTRIVARLKAQDLGLHLSFSGRTFRHGLLGAWWPFERMWRMVRPNIFWFFSFNHPFIMLYLLLTIFSHVSKTSMKFKPVETDNFEQLRRSQDLQLLQLLTEFLPSCCKLPP